MPDKKKQKSEEALVNVLPTPPEEKDNFATLASNEGIHVVSTVMFVILIRFVYYYYYINFTQHADKIINHGVMGYIDTAFC